jgi:hypothetical protein|tara:strand:- start:6725 stop:7276 length:552 start_codon:yes stop_codon:yes gene_type:complete
MARRNIKKENYDRDKIDPFSVPPAGYGLTTAPGKWAWEQPPEHVNVEDAFEEIKAKMMIPANRMTMIQLVDAGVPIETLTRTITFTGFTQGKFTPDVAELLNPVVAGFIAIQADKAGITPRMLNNPPETSIDDDVVFDIMKELNPVKYRKLVSMPVEVDVEEEEPDERPTTAMNFMEMEREDG